MLKLLGNSVADSLMPVPEYIKDWRLRNGQQENEQPSLTFKNGTTNCTSWGRDAASNVTLCVVGGQGHAWPGHCSILNQLVPGCGCSTAIDASHHALVFLKQQQQQQQQQQLLTASSVGSKSIVV